MPGRTGNKQARAVCLPLPSSGVPCASPAARMQPRGLEPSPSCSMTRPAWQRGSSQGTASDLSAPAPNHRSDVADMTPDNVPERLGGFGPGPPHLPKPLSGQAPLTLRGHGVCRSTTSRFVVACPAADPDTRQHKQARQGPVDPGRGPGPQAGEYVLQLTTSTGGNREPRSSGTEGASLQAPIRKKLQVLARNRASRTEGASLQTGASKCLLPPAALALSCPCGGFGAPAVD